MPNDTPSAPKTNRVATAFHQTSARLRFKRALVAGIILGLIGGALVSFLGFIDESMRGKLAAWGLGEYFRFEGSGLIAAILLLYFIGFLATSDVFHLVIVPKTIGKIPFLRRPLLWFYRTQKRFFDYRSRTWVYVEMFGSGTERFRFGYIVNRIFMPKRLRRILGEYHLLIVFVPSRSISLDPFGIPPSARIIVLEDISGDEIMTLVLSSGALAPDTLPETCKTWPEWVAESSGDNIFPNAEKDEMASAARNAS